MEQPRLKLFLAGVGGSCLNSSSYSYMEDLLAAPALAFFYLVAAIRMEH